jgi:hypothetical protein
MEEQWNFTTAGPGVKKDRLGQLIKRDRMKFSVWFGYYRSLIFL